MTGPEIAALQEQLARLVDEADALANAVDDAVKDARRDVLGTQYARMRRISDPSGTEAGSLAQSLRDRRLGLWTGAPAPPPPYAGPTLWPRAIAGRSQQPA